MELNIDTFGKIVDDFLEGEDIYLMVHMPKGTIRTEIKSNCGGGPVIDMYVLVQALRYTIDKLFESDMLDESMKEEFLDGTLELVKRDILEGTP